jgi:hypothetical protein
VAKDMRTANTLVILCLFCISTACSDNTDSSDVQTHFLQEKTDALDKARQAETLMLKTAEEQAESMKKQLQ